MREYLRYAEAPRVPESDVSRFVTKPIAHIAFGAVKRRFMQPGRYRVKERHKRELHDAGPEALQPLVAKGNIASNENRSRAPQMTPFEWNVKVWNSLNDYMADTVPQTLREEKLNAFAMLDLKPSDDTKDAMGRYTQVEQFRERYVDYISKKGSDMGLFISDLSGDLQDDQGAVNLQALEARLRAIEPLLGVFGEGQYIPELVKQYAMTHGLLTQTGEKKTAVVEKAAAEIGKPERGSSMKHIKSIWNTMSNAVRRGVDQRRERVARRHTQRESAQHSEPPARTREPQPPEHQSTYQEPPEFGTSPEGLTAAQVANALLDYHTGEVTNTQQLNLKQSYESALARLQWHVQTDPGYYGNGPLYIMSDVAYAMAKRITEESREKGKDLPFLFVGKVIPRAEGNIHFIALASPIGNYLRDDTTYNHQRDYAEAQEKEWNLISSTGLYDTFTHVESNSDLWFRSEHTQSGTGDYGALTHADRQLSEQLFREAEPYGLPAQTGVATSGTDRSLVFNVVLTQRDEGGAVQRYEYIPYSYYETLQTEIDNVDPSLGNRFFTQDGRGFTISKMQRGSAVEVITDTNEVITGDRLTNMLEHVTADTLQPGSSLIQRANGKMYFIDGITAREHGDPEVCLRDWTGNMITISANVLREALHTDRGAWYAKEAQRYILDSTPLDDEEASLASAYLTYNEVRQASGETISYEADREYFNTLPAKYYAREFTNMVNNFGEQWLQRLAYDQAGKLTQRLETLGISVSEYGQSATWYLWTVAKERVLAKHSDIQSSMVNADRYRAYDPLEQYAQEVINKNVRKSQEAENDILNTMLGWEIYRYNNYTDQSTSERLAMGIVWPERRRLRALLAEAPVDGRDNVSAYKLREIGEIVTKYLLEDQSVQQQPMAA